MNRQTVKPARDRKLIRTHTIPGLSRGELERLVPGGTGAVPRQPETRIARPPRGRKLEVHP